MTRFEETFTITADALDNEGRGIGTLPSGKRIFVNGILPGETCRVVITDEKKTYAEGRATELLEASCDRVIPFGEIIPGANLAHMAYSAQLSYKADKVRSCLERIGRIDKELLDQIMLPIVPASRTTHYRNHMQYRIDRNRICLTLPDSNVPVPIGECPLEYDVFTKVRAFLDEVFRDAPTELFCGLVLRGSERTKELLVEFVSDLDLPHEVVIGEAKKYISSTRIAKKLPGSVPGYTLKGIVLRISPSRVSKRTRSGKRIVITGIDTYCEKLCGCTFGIKSGAFFQVNTEQAELLYEKAAAGIGDAKVIWDVYCGTGSIGLSCVYPGQKLIGIESVSEAVASAKLNAEMSGIKDAVFVCRPAEKIDLTKDDLPHPDAVIVDPPRKGMDPVFIKKLLELSPDKITYISCDPATMARDLKSILGSSAYSLVSVRPVDVFPNSGHVETVALLRKWQTS